MDGQAIVGTMIYELQTDAFEYEDSAREPEQEWILARSGKKMRALEVSLTKSYVPASMNLIMIQRSTLETWY